MEMAEAVYRGAMGGAKDASPATLRKWAKALKGKREAEA
jgi:hypothetical protein